MPSRVKKEPKPKVQKTKKTVPFKQTRNTKRKSKVVLVQKSDKTTQVCQLDLRDFSHETISLRSKMRRLMRLVAEVYKEKIAAGRQNTNESSTSDEPAITIRKTKRTTKKK